MRLLVCLVLPIAAWCAPAILARDNVVSDESLKPLVRVKRAEEIMFGNHQNNAQFVKKSDPQQVHALEADETTIDKKSFISAETKSKDNDVIPANDVPAPGQVDAGKVKDAAKVKDESTEEEDELMKEAEQEGDESEGADSSEEPAESSGEEESTESATPDERYFYDYYNYPYRGYRKRRQAVEKRAAPELLTAESMNNKEEPISSARSKRDLTAEDIYEWLETGVGPRDSYPDYEGPDLGDYPWGGAPQLVEEPVDYPSPNELDYGPYGEYSEPATAVNPNDKELLSLLEYLVETEAPQEPPLATLYPEDIKEEWVEVEEEPQDTVQYEPILYNGIPGIFIPLEQGGYGGISKRNIDPGNRKRSGGYGDDGGRWGPFVDRQEEKRNAEAYDRLVRMAEALNSPADRYMDEFGYKKK